MLHEIGLMFVVVDPAVDEILVAGAPSELTVLDVAWRKALAAARHPQGVPHSKTCHFLAADTIGVVDGEAIGKPRDAEGAQKILERLSGRTHEVLTGVVVMSPDGTRHEGVERTEVTFDDLSPETIDAYVRTGEPLDKACAYAIQGKGAAFVRELSGDYFNVVGLPLRRTIRLLDEAGFERRRT